MKKRMIVDDNGKTVFTKTAQADESAKYHPRWKQQSPLYMRPYWQTIMQLKDQTGGWFTLAGSSRWGKERLCKCERALHTRRQRAKISEKTLKLLVTEMDGLCFRWNEPVTFIPYVRSSKRIPYVPKPSQGQPSPDGINPVARNTVSPSP